MNASEIETLSWLKDVYDTQLQPFMDVFLPGLAKDDDLFNGLLLLTSRCQFHQRSELRTAFALVDPERVKNTVKSSVSFYAFGIYKRKSCT